MKRYNSLIIFFITALIVAGLFAPSCANTSASPSGGPKDTIPPVLIATIPEIDHIHHPVIPKQSQITITFNEYVVLKDAINNIFLSPPTPKKPQAKIKGKSVVVSFQDTLAPNTTYTLDYGQSIADNNEGNPFPQFVYSFSTGDCIDSIYLSGTVVDAASFLPMEKATVILHTDPSDSALYNLPPIAAAKSDSWGYFTIRNIKPGKYRVFAINDLNNNNRYDPYEESVAFLDSLFVADSVMRPGLPALAFYDKKDTVNCMARPSFFELYLFKELPSKQFVKNYGRPSARMMFVKFSAPYVQIDSLDIMDVDSTKLLTQFNVMQDSLCIWVNDPKPLPDTLLLSIKYMKTDDSTNLLIPSVETLKMAAPKKRYEKDDRGDLKEVVDTVAKYTLKAQGETIEQEGFIFEFDSPLSTAPWDSLRFEYITTKQQTKNQEFTVVQDSTNIKRYVVKPTESYIIGYEYVITLPHRLFVDINGLPCDSIQKRVSIPNDDKLSSITFDMTGVNGIYLVELVNEKRDRVFRHYQINSDTQLHFPYLSEGKYSLRITEDRNGNGLIDTGSLLEKRQPEKVRLYKFGEGSTDKSYLLEIGERMEIEQSINISEMFQ